MTSNSYIFTSKTCPVIKYIVYTADNSIMHVQNTRTLNTPKLSISDVFYVPKVFLNILFVDQFCEFGGDVHFLSRNCFVQDP